MSRARRPAGHDYGRESYRVLAADPPWPFGDALPGAGRGAAKNYGLLTLTQIERFPLPPIADDAVLFLWRVSSMVEEAYRVARAWGFKPKSELVWRKMRRCGKCVGTGVLNAYSARHLPRPCEVCGKTGTREHFGMGRSVRAAHETCVIATRGRPQRLDGSIRSVFSALVPTDERGKVVHSAKPPEFYAIAERLYGGPRVELFARRGRPGWDCHGDQLGDALDPSRVTVQERE